MYASKCRLLCVLLVLDTPQQSAVVKHFSVLCSLVICMLALVQARRSASTTYQHLLLGWLLSSLHPSDQLSAAC